MGLYLFSLILFCFFPRARARNRNRRGIDHEHEHDYEHDGKQSRFDHATLNTYWVGDPFNAVFGLKPMSRLWWSFAYAARGKHSLLHPNGMKIMQPRIASTELPWVLVSKIASTLKGLH